MTDVRKELRKLAADHYDEAAAIGERFTINAVAESLTEDLVLRLSDTDRSVTRDLLALLAHLAVERVDKSRTAIDAAQGSLLEALDQPIALDEGERLSRRRMTAQDWTTHLGHVASNAARVNASAARENARFAALAPYLTGDTTTEQAIAAWQVDNPGEELR